MELNDELKALLESFKDMPTRPAGRLDSFYGRLEKLHVEYFEDKRFGEFVCGFIEWLYIDRKTDPFFTEEKSMAAHLENYAKAHGTAGGNGDMSAFYKALTNAHKCDRFVDWRFGQLMMNYLGWLQKYGIEPKEIENGDFIANLLAFSKNRDPFRTPLKLDGDVYL